MNPTEPRRSSGLAAGARMMLRGGGRLLRGGAALGLRCLPVLAFGAFFAHLAHFGLRPTLAERERLRQACEEVLDRRVELDLRHRELERHSLALDDSFYRARLRRAAALAERDATPTASWFAPAPQDGGESQAAPGWQLAAAQTQLDPTWATAPGELERLTRRPAGAPLRGPGAEGAEGRSRRSLVR
jgi:hypothetical protein